jgi:hypothetical protein
MPNVTRLTFSRMRVCQKGVALKSKPLAKTGFPSKLKRLPADLNRWDS